nr:GntR family transcriptional regulator [uncultured Halomonas sp.]
MNNELLKLWDDNTSDSSVRQRLYRVLRQSIIRMVLSPGQALSEKEIADTFDVSRQPVRESFIRLSEAGLVEVRPQRGTYVVRVSQAAVLEARFVREAVEVAVAKSAAERGLDDAVIAELYDLIERQKRCAAPHDYDRFFLLDEAFHRTLSLGAGHHAAWRVTEEVKAQLDRVRYLSVPETTPLPKLIDQHTRIVETIAERNVEAAEVSMRAHQREILQSLPELVGRFPDMFDAKS